MLPNAYLCVAITDNTLFAITFSTIIFWSKQVWVAILRIALNYRPFKKTMKMLPLPFWWQLLATINFEAQLYHWKVCQYQILNIYSLSLRERIWAKSFYLFLIVFGPISIKKKHWSGVPFWNFPFYPFHLGGLHANEIGKLNCQCWKIKWANRFGGRKSRTPLEMSSGFFAM